MLITYTSAKEYVLYAEDGTFLGNLKFENWHANKASILTQFGEFYDLATKGFWGTSIVVTKAGNEYAELKMNWKGHIIIDLTYNGENVDYIVKLNSMWKSQFVLQNRQEQDLLILIPGYKWATGHYDYKVEINPDFQEEVNETLVLLAAYSAVYISMMTGMGTA
jgi:hypothetical protein